MKQSIKNKIKAGEKLEIAGLKYGPKRQTFKGRNGNAEYNPHTKQATSYDWWTFAIPIKNVVIFNTYRYSMTTGTHQYAVLSLLSTLGEKVLTLNLGEASLTESSFKSGALKVLYTQLIQNEFKLKGNIRKDTRAELETSQLELNRQIQTVRRLGATISRAALNTLRTDLELKEVERIEQARQNRQTTKEAQYKMRQLEKQGEVFTLSL